MATNESKYKCHDQRAHDQALEAAKKDILTEKEILSLSETFKILGDHTRLRILDALGRTELCVCALAEFLGMTSSAVSHQLRILRSSRLVKLRRQGKNIYYSLDDDHVRDLVRIGLEHLRHQGSEGV